MHSFHLWHHPLTLCASLNAGIFFEHMLPDQTGKPFGRSGQVSWDGKGSEGGLSNLVVSIPWEAGVPQALMSSQGQAARLLRLLAHGGSPESWAE